MEKEEQTIQIKYLTTISLRKTYNDIKTLTSDLKHIFNTYDFSKFEKLELHYSKETFLNFITDLEKLTNKE